MNVRFFALILAALFSVPVFAQYQKDQKPKDARAEAVLKLLDDWDNAYIKKDAAPLEKFLADDYIGIDENGDITRKPEEIALIKTGEYVIHSVNHIEPPSVRFHGSTAVATTFATVKQTYKGETSEFKARATTVCIEKNGSWIVVSWHGSKLPAK
jgi:ketosteroid isomerase-like protein